jgi:hypothetical protein
MAREDNDVRDDDNVDQTNYYWMVQNMAERTLMWEVMMM